MKFAKNRPWIAYVDDERDIDNSIIVTLATGWYFKDEPNNGVRGYDTVAEAREDTVKSKVTFKK